jgi:hypothetical protein
VHGEDVAVWQTRSEVSIIIYTRYHETQQRATLVRSMLPISIYHSAPAVFVIVRDPSETKHTVDANPGLPRCARSLPRREA